MDDYSRAITENALSATSRQHIHSLRRTSSLDVLTVTNAVAGVQLWAVLDYREDRFGWHGQALRAVDTRLDREVALKLVSESYLSGDTPHIPPPLVEAVPLPVALDCLRPNC